MKFYVRLGERLRALRNRAGLSQAALGAKLGRSASAIDRYEIGQRRISLADLLRLSRVLGVAPETFFEGSATRGAFPRVRSGADTGSRLRSVDRLHAEHLRLLRELDRRLAYPISGSRPDAVREKSRVYGGRRGRSEEGISPEAYAATLSPAQLRAWARRAKWSGAADPNVLRRFAALVLRGFTRGRGRERR